MSRALRFRCWDKVAGLYLSNGNWTGINQDGNPWLVIEGKDVLVDSDRWVVEQYTGLKDKNGREIYEGDIVNITAVVETDDSNMACIIDTNSIVCWDKEHARWDVNDSPEDEDWDYRRRRYFVFVDSEDREDVEVIGNIHENPELLEGEE